MNHQFSTCSLYHHTAAYCLLYALCSFQGKNPQKSQVASVIEKWLTSPNALTINSEFCV